MVPLKHQLLCLDHRHGVTTLPSHWHETGGLACILFCPVSTAPPGLGVGEDASSSVFTVPRGWRLDQQAAGVPWVNSAADSVPASRDTGCRLCRSGESPCHLCRLLSTLLRPQLGPALALPPRGRCSVLSSVGSDCWSACCFGVSGDRAGPPAPRGLPPPWAALGRHRASLWVPACPVLLPFRVLIGSLDPGPRLLLVCMPPLRARHPLNVIPQDQPEPSSHLRVSVASSQVFLLGPGC